MATGHSTDTRLVSRMLAFGLIWLLAGCASSSTYIAPEPASAESAGLAVRLGTTSWLGDKPATRAVFARLDETPDGSLLSDELHVASFSGDDYQYLLNVPAGRYAVVAYYLDEEVYRGPGDQTPIGTIDKHAVYLSEDVVRQSVVDVPAGRLVFMGDIAVTMQWGFGITPDVVQSHYLELLPPLELARRCTPDVPLPNSLVAVAVLGVVDSRMARLEGLERDEPARARFLERATGGFEISRWLYRLERP